MTNSSNKRVPNEDTCPITSFQTAKVSVPVTVTPVVKTGEITTVCCGDPVISPVSNNCDGRKNGCCQFTITQKICVTVPVELNTVTTIGDPMVHCCEVTDYDTCKDCDSGCDKKKTADKAK